MYVTPPPKIAKNNADGVPVTTGQCRPEPLLRGSVRGTRILIIGAGVTHCPLYYPHARKSTTESSGRRKRRMMEKDLHKMSMRGHHSERGRGRGGRLRRGRSRRGGRSGGAALQRRVRVLQQRLGVTVAPRGSLWSGITHVGKTDLYLITMKR